MGEEGEGGAEIEEASDLEAVAAREEELGKRRGEAEEEARKEADEHGKDAHRGQYAMGRGRGQAVRGEPEALVPAGPSGYDGPHYRFREGGIMVITLIITGGIVLITAIALGGDYLTKVKTAKVKAGGKDYEELRKRIKALEQKSLDQETKLERLESDLAFANKLLEDKTR
jgi:hypothetical protein